MNMTAEAPRTVLIIEDSNVQSKIIRKQIQALTQFDTLIAHSMQEAEALLRDNGQQIFIAVIDLNLPDAPDGEAVDLCLAWKVPSIVLTATFNDEIRRRFIERRVVDYFFKGSIQDMDPMVASLERVFKNQFITALVVDDSRTQRAQIKKLLEVQRFRVLDAGDGVEALAVFEQNPHTRLVITDYQMPNMDGIELVRELRGRHKMDRVAIIGVSSVGSGPLTAQFLKNGANDFLTKPFEVEEFYWRVNHNMDVLDMICDLKSCMDSLDAH